jgi:hypothetical protein
MAVVVLKVENLFKSKSIREKSLQYFCLFKILSSEFRSQKSRPRLLRLVSTHQKLCLDSLDYP